MKIIQGSTIIDSTPEIIAKEFCEMGSEEQARFFNEIADISFIWKGGGLCFQLQYITDEDGLNLSGRRVMSAIGDYSHWGLTDKGAYIDE